MTKAAKLAQAAKAAAEVRAYQTDPDVVALRVERVRGWVDRLIWTGMVLGLLFTMANVAHFAAGDAKKWTLPWTTAWLLDPMVSLVLIGVLMGEQVINRHKLEAGGWVRTTKWVALSGTYAMNTWSAWAALNPAKILQHSVPVAIVFCAAEAVVTIRQKITEAVTVAYEQAAERRTALEQTRADSAPSATDDRQQIRTQSRTEPAPCADETRTDNPHAPVRAEFPQPAPHADSARPLARVPASGNGSGNAVRSADGAPPVDRDALVAELAEQIREAIRAGEKWRPDYPELMEHTGYKRRWCEEVVRDARHTVLRADAPEDDTDSSADSAPDSDQTRAETPQAVRAEATRNAPASPDADSTSVPARGNDTEDADPAHDAAEATELAGVGGERS
ncbi:hypothetical protein [Actinoallomurus sp. CA-150999]|uniref:hypothetical protein n=1 Tax=Actinoallomurus sp. CA-150999 TaxID=3239887 RepID=UPI003D8D4F27